MTGGVTAASIVLLTTAGSGLRDYPTPGPEGGSQGTWPSSSFIEERTTLGVAGETGRLDVRVIEVGQYCRSERLANKSPIEWPEGKDFAFTIFDDTDLATLENVRGVYDFLDELGLRTTKSVWPIRGDGEQRFGGVTCDDPDYMAWTLELQVRGFEIGFHGAAPSTSTRETTVFAIERFKEIYGHYPRSMANHADSSESIYWGSDRVTGTNRLIFDVMTGFRRSGVSRGHREGDPLFWGDVCLETVRYVRNFTFRDIDTLAACPMMPYHDPDRPYVNYWFAASEGADVGAFIRCLSPANQDRLEANGSASIVYTHLAAGFSSRGALNPDFRRLMERIAHKNGWFVPVVTLLDFLREQHGESTITAGARGDMERRWLMSKVRVGSS